MTPLAIFGGTTGQRAAAQDTWDNATYPRGWFNGHNVKLTFDPDASNAMSGAGGHIVMSGQALVEEVWWMFLHEVGHLADFWCLDDSGRAQVMAVLGRSTWDKPSKEAWAQSFPLAFMPPDRGYSYPGYPVSASLVRTLMDECGEGENMASSEQIREWYHDGVVLNHADRNTPGYTPDCDHRQPRVSFPAAGGGAFSEPVHPLTVEAWKAYVQVMRFHGETMSSAGGVNHCRNIGSGNMPSLHAYLCAVDLPPNSAKSDEFIRDIEVIRMNSGAQVFRNLAGDRMHDQINCSPTDLASGIDWSTVAGYQGDEDMAVMDEETQQFWVDVKTELDKLDPNTTASVLKSLVEFKREHPSTVSGITKGEADGRYVKTGGTYKIS